MSADRFAQLSPTDLELLRDRARELARAEERKSVEDNTELLVVESRGQKFAIPLTAVETVGELSTLAAVPRAPAFVRGLVPVRGEVLIAVELGAILGGTPTGFADLRRIVTLCAGDRKLALLTEPSLSVHHAPEAAFKADALRPHPALVGTDEAFVSLVAPAALIDHVFEALKGRT